MLLYFTIILFVISVNLSAQPKPALNIVHLTGNFSNTKH